VVEFSSIMVIVRKRVPGVSETMLERFAQKARKAVALHGAVNLLVTNSRELRSLNGRFRGKDTPTDVLSFPALMNPPQDFAGDIAISADIAAQNAKILGHSAGDELKILILHGMLHLAGYDHERDNGTMARKEQRLRRDLGLPAGLIERTTPGHVDTADSPVSGGRVARRHIASVHTTTGKTPAKRRKR
jgi:probable rRNA maturation factor